MTRDLRFYLLLGVLAAGGFWFYKNFEYTTQREHVGFRGEAARNPLLALQRLLERMGSSVRQAKDAAELERTGAGATMFVPRGRASHTRARAERLASWVAQGGHLIIEAERLHERDTVLDALSIERRDVAGAAPEPKRRRERAAESGRSAPAEIRLPDPSLSRGEGEAKSLRVLMPHAVRLVPAMPDRTRLAQQDAFGTTLLHLEVGRGRVTVLPSFAFLTNETIGQHDHAAFALVLVNLATGSGSVIIAPRFEQPSLIEWLAREARVPLAAGAVLLFLSLWRSANRFGPLAPRPERARRRLLDHLRASGRYLWRSGAAASLLAAARESCLHRIARARPALADLPLRQRVPRLADLTQMPTRDIEHAWTGTPDTPAAFTAAVRTLQQIEEKLTRRAGG